MRPRGRSVTFNPRHPAAPYVDGKRLVTDGPFAETREQLGGFFRIDAKDVDEAIGVAGRLPGARMDTIEIRPVIEIAGLPAPVEYFLLKRRSGRRSNDLAKEENT